MMLRRFALASVLLIASSAAPAMAQTATSPLGVSATVIANCTISTTAVAFGNYDPIVTNASAAKANTAGSITTTCTNGSTVGVRLGQGANAAGGSTDDVPLRQMINGANVLGYSLYQDAGLATIWGNTAATDLPLTGSGIAQITPIFGSITGGQNKPAGSYTDTVVAAVDF
ncbi:spore coat U domain-containing protein [Nostoc sphaeroides]|uniref:SCPU domain-containing protein n=1 Tax=Nostoc sphaeroides CCNUC1 TaxID=2653204 RepID=A0A5P8W001_9NOSO|nr:spore coat U domain-containing protein [Nostoc sphaeroides]QFS46045.1 SCPU domain-containing protein [Nostoc sphaeroides CCNUC1]